MSRDIYISVNVRVSYEGCRVTSGMVRRRRGTWMTASDDTLLEHLAETGGVFNKRSLEYTVQHRGGSISYATLKRRLPKLESAGLVEVYSDAGTHYHITNLGRRYLAGEISDVEAEAIENALDGDD